MNKFMSLIGLVCLLFGVANAEVISKDGVATDTVTGLMWQDNISNSDKQVFWDQTKQYCKDLHIGGYTDWRVPNIYELVTLIDNTKYSGIDILDGIKSNASMSYWSSNTDSFKESNAWIVNIDSQSTVTTYDKTIVNSIRCVRGDVLTYGMLSNLNESNKLKVSNEYVSKISPIRENEIKDFMNSKKLNSKKSFELFLEKYPDGLYATEVKNLIKQIEKQAYEYQSSKNTITAYKKYLKEYPNGEYASSARSNIQYLESEAQFRSLIQSKSPQTMYIEAGKQERNGNTSKANKLYEAIIDRFPNSDFAVKASDKLTSAERTERTESNRRSQSRQECENNKNACLAGCGTYISGADSHNSAVWSCNDKCKQISCY